MSGNQFKFAKIIFCITIYPRFKEERDDPVTQKILAQLCL